MHCQKPLDVLHHKANIIFCPHCQKSLLFDNNTPFLTKGFLNKNFFKNWFIYHTYDIVFLAIVLCIFGALYIFEINGLLIIFVGLIVSVGVFGVYADLYHKNQDECVLPNQKTQVVLSCKLTKGVDKLSDNLNTDSQFGVGATQEKLSRLFYRRSPIMAKSSIFCPHCQSQHLVDYQAVLKQTNQAPQSILQRLSNNTLWAVVCCRCHHTLHPRKAFIRLDAVRQFEIFGVLLLIVIFDLKIPMTILLLIILILIDYFMQKYLLIKGLWQPTNNTLKTQQSSHK